MQAPSVGSVGSAKGFTRHVAGINNSSEGHRHGGGHGGGSGPVDIGAGGGADRTSEANGNGEVGSGVEENSDHSGEGVEDDGVSTVSRGSLLVGEPRPDVTKHRPSASIIPTGGGGGGGGASSSGGLGDYKLGEGKDNLSDESRHMESDDGDADGLVGSTFLGNFGDHGAVATAAGVSVGAVGGGAEGWARVRGLRNRPLSYRHHHPRIRPIHASPKATPTEEWQKTSAEDSGLGGVEFLSSPGGTGVLDTFCSPLSEATAAAAGSEMTQAGDG